MAAQHRDCIHELAEPLLPSETAVEASHLDVVVLFQVVAIVAAVCVVGILLAVAVIEVVVEQRMMAEAEVVVEHQLMLD